jgi:hypothetical protein
MSYSKGITACLGMKEIIKTINMRYENFITSYLSNQLPKIHMQFYNINAGGCGKFAQLLRNSLLSIGIDTTIHLLDSPYSSIVPGEVINKTSTVEEINNLGTNVSHIVLGFNGMYMDSTGVNQDIHRLGCRSVRYACELEPDTLDRLVNDGAGWNWMFERRQIPAIEVKIIEMVEDLRERLKEYHNLYIRGLDTTDLLAA